MTVVTEKTGTGLKGKRNWGGTQIWLITGLGLIQLN